MFSREPAFRCAELARCPTIQLVAVARTYCCAAASRSARNVRRDTRMALEVESVAVGGRNRREALCGARRFEPLKLPFASPIRRAWVLDATFHSQSLLVPYARADVSERLKSAIRLRAVGYSPEAIVLNSPVLHCSPGARRRSNAQQTPTFAIAKLRHQFDKLTIQVRLVASACSVACPTARAPAPCRPRGKPRGNIRNRRLWQNTARICRN